MVIAIVDRKGLKSKISTEIEKATKNNPKFWLKCGDLKFQFSETKAELLSRYKFTVYTRLIAWTFRLL